MLTSLRFVPFLFLHVLICLILLFPLPLHNRRISFRHKSSACAERVGGLTTFAVGKLLGSEFSAQEAMLFDHLSWPHPTSPSHIPLLPCVASRRQPPARVCSPTGGPHAAGSISRGPRLTIIVRQTVSIFSFSFSHPPSLSLRP